jgi:hypothetical protein
MLELLSLKAHPTLEALAADSRSAERANDKDFSLGPGRFP